jgi:uncharacterized protein YbbC (DUF1343 family)
MRSHLVLGLAILASCAPRPGPGPAAAILVRPGIDVLLSDSIHLVRGRRVALLTNHTGLDRAGRRTVDRLVHTSSGAQLVALFSPEHGFHGTEDRPGLPDAVDSATGLPIYSLYAGSRPPKLDALDSVDALLIDLQDIGARYYTYVGTAAVLMREAARRGRPVLVLDRPNPVGGGSAQGNVRTSCDRLEILVGPFPVAMRHGLTIGELTRLANDECALGAKLTVIPATGWRREMYFDATGLPWVPPSPNMPSLESAMHYPGTALFEYTNLSVGRGTPMAFQVLGAPWLEATAVLRRVSAAGDSVPGVRLTDTTFTPHAPSDGKFDAMPLRGVRLEVVDRTAYDPARTAVVLLAAIRHVHRDSLRFNAAPFDRLAAGPELRDAIVAGRSARDIVDAWSEPLDRYRRRCAKYLLY